MRKLFFAGLATFLPFALTIVIVLFVINLFTNPFQGSVASLLDYYNLLNKPFLFFSGEEMLYLSSKFLVLIALFCFIILIGFLGRLVITKTLFKLSDYAIQRIPFFNKIYKTTQELVNLLFQPNSSSFSQAALVPFPYPDVYCMGFISKKQTSEDHSEKVLVFVPGTPNPTAGYLLSYKYEEIIFLEMKVEDALKFLISCGMTNLEVK